MQRLRPLAWINSQARQHKCLHHPQPRWGWWQQRRQRQRRQRQQQRAAQAAAVAVAEAAGEATAAAAAAAAAGRGLVPAPVQHRWVAWSPCPTCTHRHQGGLGGVRKNRSTLLHLKAACRGTGLLPWSHCSAVVFDAPPRIFEVLPPVSSHEGLGKGVEICTRICHDTDLREWRPPCAWSAWPLLPATRKMPQCCIPERLKLPVDSHAASAADSSSACACRSGAPQGPGQG
jgi:hypothetical protein